MGQKKTTFDKWKILFKLWLFIRSSFILKFYAKQLYLIPCETKEAKRQCEIIEMKPRAMWM